VFELDDSISAAYLIQKLNILNTQLDSINPDLKMSDNFLLGLLGQKIHKDIYKTALADADKTNATYVEVCNQLRRANIRLGHKDRLLNDHSPVQSFDTLGSQVKRLKNVTNQLRCYSCGEVGRTKIFCPSSYCVFVVVVSIPIRDANSILVLLQVLHHASTASKHQLSKGKDVHKKDFKLMKVKEGPVYPVDAFSFRNEDALLSHLNNATNSQIVKLNK